ncbi:MAG: hypothetical protein Q8K58_02560 [Acidimicrobiales bacterium]|nr:hypothetical protein [Acidimicrobiales bacterium]
MALARAVAAPRTLAYALWAWRWHLMVQPDIGVRLAVSEEAER